MTLKVHVIATIVEPARGNPLASTILPFIEDVVEPCPYIASEINRITNIANKRFDFSIIF